MNLNLDNRDLRTRGKHKHISRWDAIKGTASYAGENAGHGRAGVKNSKEASMQQPGEQSSGQRATKNLPIFQAEKTTPPSRHPAPRCFAHHGREFLWIKQTNTDQVSISAQMERAVPRSTTDGFMWFTPASIGTLSKVPQGRRWKLWSAAEERSTNFAVEHGKMCQPQPPFPSSFF